MDDGLPPLREVIAAHGLRAKKSLGQNFLHDFNLTTKIARHAGDLAGCDVLEVGPGPGGLTRAMLAQGARRIVAIEKDRRCIAALDDIAMRFPGRLTVLAGDALSTDPAPCLSPPVRIVSNLPFNVGTRLLTGWLSSKGWPPFWTSLTLTFQKEVAERIVARPGTRSYGRISVLCQWRSTARLLFEIPPSAFTPRPGVTSAVVHIESRPPDASSQLDPALLAHVTACAFGQRRKMLRRSLAALAPDIASVLEAVGVSPEARADSVSVSDYCAIGRAVRRSPGTG